MCIDESYDAWKTRSDLDEHLEEPGVTDDAPGSIDNWTEGDHEMTTTTTNDAPNVLRDLTKFADDVLNDDWQGTEADIERMRNTAIAQLAVMDKHEGRAENANPTSKALIRAMVDFPNTPMQHAEETFAMAHAALSDAMESLQMNHAEVGRTASAVIDTAERSMSALCGLDQLREKMLAEKLDLQGKIAEGDRESIGADHAWTKAISMLDNHRELAAILSIRA